MAVITISREYGSGGRNIAQNVASILGYHFVNKEFIETVLNQYGFIEFGSDYDAVPGFWNRYDRRKTEMIDMMNQVIRSVARHGNIVLLGRGSFIILNGYADVLNVRLQAPFVTRVQQVMKLQNIDNQEQAETVVKEQDKVRAAFLDSYYEMRWDSANAFDIVLNTAKVSSGLIADCIADAAIALQAMTDLQGQTTGNIQENHVLDQVVAKALGCQLIHQGKPT